MIRDLPDLLNKIVEIINEVLVPLVFAIAFIVFIWGIFQYFIAGASNDEAKEKGKSLMIYGLIGFFVMASVWGIVNLLVNTFGLDTGVDIEFPDAINRNP